jgi:predicted negative regulator of RcsB-dependent stress response
MAKQSATGTPPTSAAGSDDAITRLVQWSQARQRPLTIGVVALVLIGGAVWFMQSAAARREAFASNELQQARVSVDAGNWQLAASDLGRVVSTYGKTRAGQDATVLLARVHLEQGQADLAVSELRTFLTSGPDAQFVAPAQGLLGAALENLGQFGEAAAAYQAAAAASRYDRIKADYLMDTGRAAAVAGDAARATSAYQAVIGMLDETEPLAIEARFRLAELQRRGSSS